MSNTPDGPSAPRASSSENAQGQPVALFDAQIRVLTDSYLSFFMERRRIEEQYVESLLKLQRKAKTVDIYLDDRFEMNTARSAWREVRDNVEREAETRLAFLASLSADVINPLVTLKETQERIRKRIREDLKEAVVAHIDYEENTFPKLKRTYMKKSQDVEELRTINHAAPPLSPTVSNDVVPFAAPKSGSSFQAVRPVVTAPQPLKPLERRASQSAHPARARSPSTSTALSDLAHQGKRQLNQLITFLDKSGNMKDSLGSRTDSALRGVRAKRDADEADKEYRKAVHWLETLRLRRMKILENGYKSVELFVHELSGTLKDVLQRYTDGLTATALTETHLCEHAQSAIDKISPGRDTLLVSARIPRLLITAAPKPQYYQNFLVGECRDLIFGVSLVDYSTAKGRPEGEIPKIVRVCIKEIEDRGLDAEGIYRVSGRQAAVHDLQHKIERNEDEFEFHAPQDDVYAVSSLLKLYLRELPEPVFRFPLQDRIQHTEEIEGHIANQFPLLRSKIRRLPPVHQATLKAIAEHLAKVASHSDKNKMDPKNLAIVFGTVIFGEDELPKGGDILLGVQQSWKDTLMEDLITHAHTIFQSSSSPPLPPAPLDEPVPTLTYGSSHTTVSELPPPPPPRSPSPAVHFANSVPPSPTRITHSTSSLGRYIPPSEDFTPQLPARPANSIHPSLRAGPMSGQAIRQSLPPPARNAQFFDDSISYAHLAPPQLSTTAAAPPSPLKRSNRVITPSPLPLKSPWSESEPSLSPARTSEESTLSFESDDAEGQEIIVPPRDTDSPPSGASSRASFTSAISPTTSVSSAGAGRPLPTPPIATKPLTPEDSPNRNSAATVVPPMVHVKGSSSSSTES